MRAALLLAAVSVRVVYASLLLETSLVSWYDQSLGTQIRGASLASFLVVALMIGAYIAGRGKTLWAASAIGLASLTVVGSRVGVAATELVPWVAALTAAVMISIALETGLALRIATGGALAAFAYWVAESTVWGALDYAVAALAVLAAISWGQRVGATAGQLRTGTRRD